MVDEPSVVAWIAVQIRWLPLGKGEVDAWKDPRKHTYHHVRWGTEWSPTSMLASKWCAVDKQVNTRNHLFSPSLRMVIGVPSGSTEVRTPCCSWLYGTCRWAWRLSILNRWLRRIGIGIDVEAPEGKHDCGYRWWSTEIARYLFGRYRFQQPYPYRRWWSDRRYPGAWAVSIMWKSANVWQKRIKINVGAALTENLAMTPGRLYRSWTELYHSSSDGSARMLSGKWSLSGEKSISRVETAILSALENTPPELYADIVHNGIYLAGGGALLRGLDKRLTDKINIPFHIAGRSFARSSQRYRCVKECRPFLFLMR